MSKVWPHFGKKKDGAITYIKIKEIEIFGLDPPYTLKLHCLCWKPFQISKVQICWYMSKLWLPRLNRLMLLYYYSCSYWYIKQKLDAVFKLPTTNGPSLIWFSSFSPLEHLLDSCNINTCIFVSITFISIRGLRFPNE